MQRVAVWIRTNEPGADAERARELAVFARSMVSRAQAAGAIVHATIGGTVVASFPSSAAGDAIVYAEDVVLAGDANAPRVSIAAGLAEGALHSLGHSGGSTAVFGVVDRAQLLASLAESGELALSPELVPRHPMFGGGRPVLRSGPRGLVVIGQAYVVRPRSEAIAVVAPTLPARCRESVDDVRIHLASGGAGVAVVRAAGDQGASAYLAGLVDELAPPLVLWLHGVASALAPLGALSTALLRAFPGGSGSLLALAGDDHEGRPTAVLGSIPPEAMRRAGPPSVPATSIRPPSSRPRPSVAPAPATLPPPPPGRPSPGPSADAPSANGPSAAHHPGATAQPTGLPPRALSSPPATEGRAARELKGAELKGPPPLSSKRPPPLPSKAPPPPSARGPRPHVPADVTSVLVQIAEGAAVERGAAIEAIATLLRAHVRPGRRPWIVLDPVQAVDPASLDVVLRAATDTAPVVVRISPDARLPPEFASETLVIERSMARLEPSDALEVVAHMLEASDTEEAVLTFARAAGDSYLAAESLVRAGVETGALGGTRGHPLLREDAAHGLTSLEGAIDARIAKLDDDARRMLELLAVHPVGMRDERFGALLDLAEIPRTTAERGMSKLEALGLVTLGDRARPLDPILRRAVIARLTPARSESLHRLAAHALEAERPDPREAAVSFLDATRAYCLALSGDTSQARHILVHVARSASERGYRRAAQRLATAAARITPDPSKRASAPPSRPPRPSSMAPPDEALLGREGERPVPLAVRALADVDAARLEEALERAISAGAAREPVERLRALGLLAQREPAAAVRTILALKARPPRDARTRARTSVAEAIVLLAAARPEEAIRSALAALRTARERRDPQAETASLTVLARCFRALGQSDAADRIEDASPG